MANNTSLIMQGFDTVGDGSGSVEANVDGSITPVNFKIISPAGHRCELHHVHLFISDNGAIKSDTFGAIAELTNGVELKVFDADDNFIINLFDGLHMTTNASFAAIASVQFLNFGSGTEQSIAVRYNLTESFGSPLISEEGGYIQYTINDDLSSLTDHHIIGQGVHARNP